MPASSTNLATADGPMHTEVFTPDGPGPWPAIVFCIDGVGPRASLSEMAERIAKTGYVVALPDLFHRSGKITDLLPPGETQLFKVFADDVVRGKFFTQFYGPATDYKHIETDVGAVLDMLGKRADVKPGAFGVTGYCMGGNISVRVAEIFGDRFKAAAAFHAGGLVTPAPDSTHTKVGQIKAKLYVAGAIEDQSFSDEQKATFQHALDAAHVSYELETYPAKHGFAVRDNPSFDSAQAERHFAALETLFASAFA